MLKKIGWLVMFAVFILGAEAVAGQGTPEGEAYLRFLHVANDTTAVSVMLQDGRTVLTNFFPGAVSDYLNYDVNRSTRITLTITPPGGVSFAREWVVPPLTAGYHTVALVGSGRDNTLDLVFIAEDTVCEGRYESGACVIFINSIKNSPLLTVNANTTPIVEEVRYRQVAVGSVPAASYFNFTAVESDSPQVQVFRLQLQFFEPNTIYIYSLRGTYPAASASNYVVGTVRRVPVSSLAFLRGLTGDLQLSDGRTLFATENILAVLEQAGYAQFLANRQIPLTIFAPMDEAVVRSAPGLYECALSSLNALSALILNHIVVGNYTIQELIDAGQLPAMSGANHTFRAAEGGFFIDNTQFVPNRLSYPTNNGHVYLIDSLLIPPNFEDRFCTQG